MVHRTLLEELEQDVDLSYATSILHSARPGTRCHELRERLAGRRTGRQVTLLVPVNSAIRKAAEKKRTTLELYCRMPEAVTKSTCLGHLGTWFEHLLYVL